MHTLEQCYYGYWFSHTHLGSTTDSWDYTQPRFEELISASLTVRLGERPGHWFKKKAETREGKKKKKASDEVFFILLYICFFNISELMTEPKFLGIQYRKQEQWNPNSNKYQESQSRLQFAFPLVQLNTRAGGNRADTNPHLQQEDSSLKAQMVELGGY